MNRKEVAFGDTISNIINGDSVNPLELYHGSLNEIVIPKYGYGEDKHDYGRGFYTTLNPELAKEWAVCTSGEDGYLHKYLLDTSELNVLDFHKRYQDVLTWLAVLSKHRSGVNSKRDRITEQKLISKYYPADLESYDVIVGYRADDSFFSFAKQAIKGEVDIALLNEIMHTGKLGYQVFIQSEKAFSKVSEVTLTNKTYYDVVNGNEYLSKYQNRDYDARKYVAELIDSDRNTLSDTIFKYIAGRVIWIA